jgi:hypothetical protein
MSGAHVVLNGAAAGLVTTGADGKFSFSGVNPPYVLTVQDGTSLLELHGLTRSNPVVATGGAGQFHSARLSGALSGPTFPLPSGQGVLIGATNGVLTASSGSAAAAYGPLQFAWMGSSPITTDVAALQLTVGGGAITGYGLFGKRSGVQLQDGVDMTGLDIAMATAATTTTTTVTFSPGAYATGASLGYATLKAGGATFLLLTSSLHPPTGTAVLLPDGGGTLLARGEDAAGNSAGLLRPAATGGTTAFALPTTVLLKNSLPAAGAAGVSKTPILSWTPVTGATLYQVRLSGGGKSYTFLLPGDASTLPVPDCSAIGAALAGATSYGWSVNAVATAGYGPDAAADPAGGGGLNEFAAFTAQTYDAFSSASTIFTTVP